jgi:hypothetical protein
VSLEQLLLARLPDSINFSVKSIPRGGKSPLPPPQMGEDAHGGQDRRPSILVRRAPVQVLSPHTTSFEEFLDAISFWRRKLPRLELLPVMIRRLGLGGLAIKRPLLPVFAVPGSKPIVPFSCSVRLCTKRLTFTLVCSPLVNHVIDKWNACIDLSSSALNRPLLLKPSTFALNCHL